MGILLFDLSTTYITRILETYNVRKFMQEKIWHVFKIINNRLKENGTAKRKFIVADTNKVKEQQRPGFKVGYDNI